MCSLLVETNRVQLWVVGDDVAAQLFEDWFAAAHLESIKGRRVSARGHGETVIQHARVEHDQHRKSTGGESAVWNAGGDVSLCDGVGSSEPSVATSLVGQDVDRSQSSVGSDQVSRKLSVVHQANDVGPGDTENVRGLLGRQFGVVGKQVHRYARSEISQQVTNGRSRCWRQLDFALIGSHGQGATAIGTVDKSCDSLALGLGKFKGSDF